MLDTNIVSYIVRGRSGAARFRSLHLDWDESLCVSSITEGEILYGLAKRPNGNTMHATMLDFLKRVPVLPWARDEASAYGRLRARQQHLGKTIEALDLLIASHAVAIGATLVTHDKAFSQIDGLTTVDWATDL